MINNKVVFYIVTQPVAENDRMVLIRVGNTNPTPTGTSPWNKTGRVMSVEETGKILVLLQFTMRSLFPTLNSLGSITLVEC